MMREEYISFLYHSYIILIAHLVGGKAGVAEHADLLGDVVPVVVGAEAGKVVLREEGAQGGDEAVECLDMFNTLFHLQ